MRGRALIWGILLVVLLSWCPGIQAAKLAEKGLDDKAKLVTMDFEGVELTTLIKFIGELTGKNFVVDERVRGKVTVVSPTKLTVGEAYKVFESILEVHGFTTVPAGKVIKIVPATIARGKSLRTDVGVGPLPQEDMMVTQVIPVRYADVNEVKNLFTPLVDKDSLLVAYQPTNTLIVTDVRSNINRLLKILKEVDISGYELQLQVIPLQHAAAEKVAQELKTLFETKQKGPQVRRPPAGQQAAVEMAVEEELKLIPDERTNSLIILATARTIEMIRGIVAQLDQEMPRGRGYIHVHYLQHAVAEDLAEVLTGVAKEAKETGDKGAKTAGGQMPVLGEKISIVPDKATNSLTIIASPQDYATLRDVIEKLDIVRAQVYVEALIAEVTLDKLRELGVEWDVSASAREGEFRQVGGTDFGLTDAFRSGALSGLILGVTKGTISVGGVEVPDIKALLQLYSRDSDVNVLSTPRLLTTDNEEAEIVVGEERPFLQSSQVTAEGSTVKTFEYKDVGITLRITPHISKGDLLRLELFTEITSFVEQLEGEAGAVVTTKRQATTSVVVEDGATVVIGGLIRDDKTEQLAKVPVLGDIPIFGWLFKAKREQKIKTNLLIFITPQIVTSAAALKQVTEQEKEIQEEALKDYKREKEKIFPLFNGDENGPSIPGGKKPAAGEERSAVESPMPSQTAATGEGASQERAVTAAVPQEALPTVAKEPAMSVKRSEVEHAARRLVNVSVDSREQSVVLRLQGDGRMENYSSFSLKEPTRVVIDLWNMERQYPQKSVTVNTPQVKGVRFGDHRDRLRVVLDITGDTPPVHTINTIGNELMVVVGGTGAPGPQSPQDTTAPPVR